MGRTGRAGKNGIGILVLGGKGEERAVVGQELKGLNVKVSSLIWQSLTGFNIISLNKSNLHVTA